MTYHIRCQSGGRCDRCPGFGQPDLCDDPLLRALQQGCPGFETDAFHADLPYPYSCLRFKGDPKICPLAWLNNIALRAW